MKRLFLIFFLFISANVFSQIKATMTLTPENAGINEPVVITLHINARADDVKAPDLSDFKVLADVTHEITNSYMTGTGTESSEVIDSKYTCVIVAKSTGKFKIDPFVFDIKGLKFKSNNAVLKIDDRRVSWNDSAAIAEKYTGFSIGKSSAPATKKSDLPNPNIQNKASEEKKIGTGTDKFEIKVPNIKMKVKTGEDFTVSYLVYKEASSKDYNGRIEILPEESFKGFDIISGPDQNLNSNGDGVRMVTNGTVQFTLRALSKGTYTLPSLKARYGDTVVISPVIDIVVE